MRRAGFTFSVAVVAACAGAGCREQTSEDPPIVLERNMYDTERYNPQSYSQFFADHRTMRPPVPGTIARDHYEDDVGAASGLTSGQEGYVLTVPAGVVQHAGGMDKLVQRGRDRYNIYCAPCHAQTGDGKGLVVCKRETMTEPCQSRGFGPLPSYADARIRQMPDGQLFATISHGVRTMPAYGPQIPSADRWAIVSYVRALEMSLMADNPPQAEPKK